MHRQTNTESFLTEGLIPFLISSEDRKELNHQSLKFTTLSWNGKIQKVYLVLKPRNYAKLCIVLYYTGCPIKRVSIKNFYSELLKASVHSF